MQIKIMPQLLLTTINHHILLAFLALVLLTKCSSSQGSPCQSDSWWDSVNDKCVQCSKCSGQLIAIRPCQLHRDTICGSIHDLKIDMTILSKTEPNWKERRKERNESLVAGNHQQEVPLDWQAVSLIAVAVACLMFFLAAAYVLIQHMREWRQIERRLDRDVEELSAKLMAKLAQVQNLENASFFIENPVIDSHTGPVEIRCVYLDQLLAEKGNNKTKSTNRGNLYIEDSKS